MTNWPKGIEKNGEACYNIRNLYFFGSEDFVLNLNWELFVLIFYFAAMLAIGVVFFLRQKSQTRTLKCRKNLS